MSIRHFATCSDDRLPDKRVLKIRRRKWEGTLGNGVHWFESDLLLALCKETSGPGGHRPPVYQFVDPFMGWIYNSHDEQMHKSKHCLYDADVNLAPCTGSVMGGAVADKNQATSSRWSCTSLHRCELQMECSRSVSSWLAMGSHTTQITVSELFVFNMPGSLWTQDRLFSLRHAGP